METLFTLIEVGSGSILFMLIVLWIKFFLQPKAMTVVAGCKYLILNPDKPYIKIKCDGDLHGHIRSALNHDDRFEVTYDNYMRISFKFDGHSFSLKKNMYLLNDAIPIKRIADQKTRAIEAVG